MSTNWGVDKETVEHPVNEILPNSKKEQTIKTRNNMDAFQKCYGK